MNWLTYTWITAISYGVFNVFMRLSSLFGMTSQLGTLILNFSAALTILGYSLMTRNFSQSIGSVTILGITFAIATGLIAAIGNTARFLSFDAKAPLATSQIIITIGQLIIVAIVSTIFFKENLTVSKIIGMLMGIAGIYFLLK